MLPTPSNPQLHKLTELMLRFFVGAVIGCVLTLVPLSYVWYFGSNVTSLEILVITISSILGGILSLFSNPQQMGRFFDSIPWF